MPDTEENLCDDDIVIFYIECPECGKKRRLHFDKYYDPYHKKCYDDVQKRLLFKDNLVRNGILKD